MALESGSFISDLNPANPAGTDNRSQGDDHIRLIKSTLKNTFPNVNGAVTATDEQINAVAAVGALTFPGMIVMWSGSVASLPSGWKLCDGVGTISTGAPVPNLVGRFIVGTASNTGGSYNVGQTGGSPDIVISSFTGGTALSEAQMPSHTHEFRADAQYSTDGDPPNTAIAYIQGDPSPGIARPGSAALQGRTYLTSKGGNQAHNHGINLNIPSANIPPYYALAFLIKN